MHTWMLGKYTMWLAFLRTNSIDPSGYPRLMYGEVRSESSGTKFSTDGGGGANLPKPPDP